MYLCSEIGCFVCKIRTQWTLILLVYRALGKSSGKNYLNEKEERNRTMSKKIIYLSLAHMSETGEEQKYVKEAFDTNWVVPLGPNVNAFEADLEKFVNTMNDNSNESRSLNKKVAALNTGTAAIHLALAAHEVQPGDEVIVQDFTFCASTNPVMYLGATPVFVDSEKDTWNMDPELLETAIKDRIEKTGRQPKAIIPVALYGMPYQIERIMEIARKYDIPVIEDAAEGFGSRYKGQVLGTFGDYGILSFNGNKIITTSGGGALICPNMEAKQKIMWLATQAREAYPYYQHETIGYNYRMSNVCAGIGRGQMTVLEDHIAHHRHVAQLYKKAFAEVDGIEFHDEMPGMESNFWLSTILIDKDLKAKHEEKAYTEAVNGAVGGAAGTVHGGGALHTDCEPHRNVEAMRLALYDEGIESRPLWKPMHLQPVYRRGEISEGRVKMEDGKSISVLTTGTSIAYINGVSEAYFKRGLCLPSGPMVTDEDVNMIVQVIKDNIV